MTRAAPDDSSPDGRPLDPKWVAPAVAAFALLVHLVFLALLPAEMRGNESADYEGFYRPLTDRLLDGRGLRDGEGRVAMRYPPGFSALLTLPVALSLGLPGGEAFWVGALIALTVAATAFLLVVLARRLSGSAGVAALAGLGWSLYPPQLWLAKQPNSELPFLVLLLAALVLWWRTGPGDHSASPAGGKKDAAAAVVAGLLLGAATLVRPIGLLIAPVLAAAALLVGLREKGRRSRALALGLLLVAGQLAAVSPWVLFVRAETGMWIPVSSGGRLSLLDGLTLGIDPDEGAPPLSERVLALGHEIQAHRAEIRGPATAAAFLGRRALEDPLPVLELVALKAARAWYGTESARHEKALLLIQVPMLALAAFGLWRFARARPAAGAMIASLVLYFWAMTFLVLSILRYMVPAMALLMVPIAALLAAPTERLVRLRFSGAEDG